MSIRDRWLLRRHAERRTVLDREATPDDLGDLRRFVGEHRGVEFFAEPETTATDATVVAVDGDGAWIRRRVGSPAVARRLARDLGIPVYDAAVVGYPRRMKEWNRTNRPA
ncbi:hypothetical protein CC117_19210 [Parafrankia colletiae]|uniref:Uncharacterized protein n=1 Tax=Parafrankia colletiae TaxID=573497 RepID=A0A1S1QR47_9ACTN|nr:hypothetical protein [Parafrankia colletiae]MCK9902850.1 hypothetical protein [Frankia sp. Cpl3]OHV35775.1 hypothetical protein CC117_19210 [Parafrankia colletiae]